MGLSGALSLSGAWHGAQPGLGGIDWGWGEALSSLWSAGCSTGTRLSRWKEGTRPQPGPKKAHVLTDHKTYNSSTTTCAIAWCFSLMSQCLRSYHPLCTSFIRAINSREKSVFFFLNGIDNLHLVLDEEQIGLRGGSILPPFILWVERPVMMPHHH